jgi:N-formylglutamate amidohydrolase
MKKNTIDCTDYHYHTLRDFVNIKTLDEPETKVALRVLKFHLENSMGFEMSDELFEDIFMKIPYLRPLHPLGSGYAMLGFIHPLQHVLQKHCIPADEYKKIMEFFRIPRFQRPRYSCILLHIPHSSTAFPEGSNYDFKDLDNEERLLIDYYTDELFMPDEEQYAVESIVFPYCRLYCDVERLINDPLEEKGLGISYNRWVGDIPLDRRSFSTLSSAFELYADFHAAVAKRIVGHSGLLLIDCHSFSSLPNLLNSNPPDIDVCIGYNDDETCPDKVVIGNIIHHFKTLGYKVGINNPFSNSKTFSVPVEYHTVMIEVNKRLYMNEETLEKTDGFMRLREDIQSLYKILLKG